MFDTKEFLNSSVSSPMETEFAPVPEGTYRAQITDRFDFRSTDSGYHILDVNWKVADAKVAKATGRDSNHVRQSVFLDMEKNKDGKLVLETGSGKNITLGRIRAALGQNEGAWKPSDMVGKQAEVVVRHRLHDGNIYAEVKEVRPLPSVI